ncbi:MAG TPA: 2-C-methyl-D-erythritol 4-phosphate cytidylyltransferase [Marmoricola sp.]|nr:2-C-methyl-D-erythritol 4-phosphate cytidylyltransferase [Marmoricola sp.]
MSAARRNTAVLLAGGVGTRVGLDFPKQLVEVAGRPLMEHTLAVFDAHPDVDDLLVLMTPGHLDAVREMVHAGGYTKVRRIIEGADTRSGTTMRALDALGQDDRKVLLHDAVRPLVSPRIIASCFAALDTYDAACVAIPSADTIIEVSPANTISSVPARANLRRVQTPQAFRLAVIRDAYAKAAADPGFGATDDCSVVLRYSPDVPISVVPGDERNLKVTQPVDVHLAEMLLQLTSGHDLPGARDEE